MYTFMVLFVICTAAYGAIWHFQSDRREPAKPGSEPGTEPGATPAKDSAPAGRR